MPTNISWKLNLEIQSGPNIVITNAVQADAYDRIEVKVPGDATLVTVDVRAWRSREGQAATYPLDHIRRQAQVPGTR